MLFDTKHFVKDYGGTAAPPGWDGALPSVRSSLSQQLWDLAVMLVRLCVRTVMRPGLLFSCLLRSSPSPLRSA